MRRACVAGDTALTAVPGDARWPGSLSGARKIHVFHSAVGDAPRSYTGHHRPRDSPGNAHALPTREARAHLVARVGARPYATSAPSRSGTGTEAVGVTGPFWPNLSQLSALPMGPLQPDVSKAPFSQRRLEFLVTRPGPPSVLFTARCARFARRPARSLWTAAFRVPELAVTGDTALTNFSHGRVAPCPHKAPRKHTGDPGEQHPL